MQFEDLSNNGKKAIEQYKNCKNKKGYVGVCPILFMNCLELNNVPNEEQSHLCKLAFSKNFWMNSK